MRYRIRDWFLLSVVIATTLSFGGKERRQLPKLHVPDGGVLLIGGRAIRTQNLVGPNAPAALPRPTQQPMLGPRPAQ